jgi:Tfp pilus assembly protein PilF
MKRLVACILIALSAPIWGEIVHLSDGTTLEGELRRTNDGWTVTAVDGKVTVIPAGQVQSIELKKSGPAASSADQGLASLRRAVANLSDPKRIVERYQSFLKQNAGSPIIKDAEQDLALWQDRLDKGLVKAGDQWVTPAQLAELQAKSMEAANQLRPLIAAGKLTEANSALDRALSVSPQNPSLLYLKGVITYRQLQLVPARTAYQAAETVIPDHAATHNNIAVILWKQRSQMQALGEYDKAMLASPLDRTILDNVTEALHALPQEHQKSDLTKRVVQHYQDQEVALEKALAAQGQYRWGSQWLDEKEFNKLRAAEKLIQDKIDALKKDSDDLQAKILKIASDIQNDKQLQQAIANATMQIDPTSGRAYQLPLPQRYFDLDRDIRSMQVDQAMKQRQWADNQALILQQRKNMPVPKYLGVQKPFDVESMPGGSANSPAPVVAPATIPAIPDTPVEAPAPKPAPKGGVDFAPVNPKDPN